MSDAARSAQRRVAGDPARGRPVAADVAAEPDPAARADAGALIDVAARSGRCLATAASPWRREPAQWGCAALNSIEPARRAVAEVDCLKPAQRKAEPDPLFETRAHPRADMHWEDIT